MMKRKIKLLSILLTMVLVLTAALPALAETLTVHYLQDESIPAEQRFTFGQESVTLSAYLVATGSYGVWTPLDVYSDIQFFDAHGGFLKACMAEVRNRIAERNINPVATATTRAVGGINGVAEFAVVNDGMYFVVQSGSNVINDDRTTRVVRTSDMMLATNGADDVDAKWIYTITPDHPYKLTIIYVDEHNDMTRSGRTASPPRKTMWKSSGKARSIMFPARRGTAMKKEPIPSQSGSCRASCPPMTW